MAIDIAYKSRSQREQERNEREASRKIARSVRSILSGIEYAAGRHKGAKRGHYHFSMKVGGRGRKTSGVFKTGANAGKKTVWAKSYRQSGKSAVASAAYRAGEKLYCEEEMRNFDYTRKGGVEVAKLLLPEGSPEFLQNRERFWNEVQKKEVRVDARLYRELEISIPLFIEPQDRPALVESFVRSTILPYGVGADFAIHNPHSKSQKGIEDELADDELPWKMTQPHVHVMFSERFITPIGFGLKNRELTKKELLKEWRRTWEDACNEYAEARRINIRIHSGTLEEQGLPRNSITHENTSVLHMGRRWEEIRARKNAKEIINKNVAIFKKEILPESFAAQMKQEGYFQNPLFETVGKNPKGEWLYRRPGESKSYTVADYLTNVQLKSFPEAYNILDKTYSKQIDAQIEREKNPEVKQPAQVVEPQKQLPKPQFANWAEYNAALIARLDAEQAEKEKAAREQEAAAERKAKRLADEEARNASRITEESRNERVVEAQRQEVDRLQNTGRTGSEVGFMASDRIGASEALVGGPLGSPTDRLGNGDLSDSGLIDASVFEKESKMPVEFSQNQKGQIHVHSFGDEGTKASKNFAPGQELEAVMFAAAEATTPNGESEPTNFYKFQISTAGKKILDEMAVLAGVPINREELGREWRFLEPNLAEGEPGFVRQARAIATAQFKAAGMDFDPDFSDVWAILDEAEKTAMAQAKAFQGYPKPKTRDDERGGR